MYVCVTENKKEQHNLHYVAFLYDQSQAFYFASVLIAAGHNIYPRSIDTAVTKNICKLGNVFFNGIKSACKQFAQIVRKDFPCAHAGFVAKAFHFTPNISAAHWFAITSYEYRT